MNEIPGIKGICIYHDCPLREKPQNESEFLTTLYLGDEIRFLGEVKTDVNNEYYKVELYDGTLGWLEKKAVLFNARQAAVVTRSSLYQQINKLEIKELILNPAEFVAIIGEEGEWVKVLGANRTKSGWMKREYLSLEDEDVFIATLAYSDLLDENGEIIEKQLPYFIHSLPDKNAPLALQLQNILEEQVADAIAESILEYELGYSEED